MSWLWNRKPKVTTFPCPCLWKCGSCLLTTEAPSFTFKLTPFVKGSGNAHLQSLRAGLGHRKTARPLRPSAARQKSHHARQNGERKRATLIPVMIVKDHQASPTQDRLQRAGDAAEQQMAFYLRRAFGSDKDVHVFQNLRFEQGGTPRRSTIWSCTAVAPSSSRAKASPAPCASTSARSGPGSGTAAGRGCPPQFCRRSGRRTSCASF